MNVVIDIIFLLCLLWGAYKGFKKGFIIQSFLILALVCAIWGGFAFGGMLKPFVHKHFNVSNTACSAVSFCLVFLFVMILVYISGYLVSRLAEATTLGMINRLAGAAFGILANLLVLSVIILLFNLANIKMDFVKHETLEKSYLYEPIEKIAPAVCPEKLKNLLK